MSIDGWMDKQSMVYTDSEILLSIKKEWNSDTCYNMDESWRHCAKRNKPDTKGQILHDAAYTRYLEWSTS